VNATVIAERAEIFDSFDVAVLYYKPSLLDPSLRGSSPKEACTTFVDRRCRAAASRSPKEVAMAWPSSGNKRP
jgi:hypothetical protein